MSNSYFQFKQFRVEQGDTAMKVSTDGCIQGACTPILPGVKKVLDIGCGTGLLSLMLAQRSAHILIDAIELDKPAALQAGENAAASPWRDRIAVMQADIRTFVATDKYDLMICNPPFFNNSLLGDDTSRNQARHTLTLSQEQLFAFAKDNLSSRGYMAIMLPVAEHESWSKLVIGNGWHFNHWVTVKDNAHAKIKRIVSTCSRELLADYKEELVIKDSGNSYTRNFVALLHPFYLYL